MTVCIEQKWAFFGFSTLTTSSNVFLMFLYYARDFRTQSVESRKLRRMQRLSGIKPTHSLGGNFTLFTCLLEVYGEIVGSALYVIFGMYLWKSVTACYPKWFHRRASEKLCQYCLFFVYAMFYTPLFKGSPGVLSHWWVFVCVTVSVITARSTFINTLSHWSLIVTAVQLLIHAIIQSDNHVTASRLQVKCLLLAIIIC